MASARSKFSPMTPAQALDARKNADIEQEQKRAAQSSSSLVRCPDPEGFYYSIPRGPFRALLKAVTNSMRQRNPGAAFNIAFFTDAATAWELSGRDQVRACVLLKSTVGKGRTTFSLDESDLADADAYLESNQIVRDLRRLYEAKLDFWSDKISKKGKAGNCRDEMCCVQFQTSLGKWTGFDWSRLVSDEAYLIEFIELMQNT